MISKQFDIIGLVLLGGKSKRMGQDKKFLLYNNKTFLENAIFLLKVAGCKEIILSGISKNELIKLSNKNFNNTNYLCLEDSISNKGPISGILRVVQQVSINKWLLVIPVDMPLLTTEITDILLQHLQEYQGDIDVLFFNNFVFPFLLKNSLSVREIINLNISKDKLSIKHLLNALNSKIIEISVNLESRLANINTLTEYKAIQNRL